MFVQCLQVGRTSFNMELDDIAGALPPVAVFAGDHEVVEVVSAALALRSDMVSAAGGR